VSATLQDLAQTYFRTQLGVEWDSILLPVSPDRPGGAPLAECETRNAIAEARREDDPSLPQGVWSHELKRADWERTSLLCLQTLAREGKDLQLAAWLLEAEINQRGLAAVAPCLTLIQALCETWWPQLHPQPDAAGPEGGPDYEARANVFHWINQKLQPALRRVPLTAAGREREYCLADWE
jgi:type VI secretion system protein ImpA